MKLDAIRTALATAETLEEQLDNIEEYENEDLHQCDQNVEGTVFLLRRLLGHRENEALKAIRHLNKQKTES